MLFWAFQIPKRKAADEGGENKEKKEKKAKKGTKKATTSQYRTIDKKRYDRGMLEAAEAGQKSGTDGKIGLDDAKKIVKEALDGHKYTQVEKNTMHYIRENFKFTDEADEHVRKAVASFAATKAAKAKKKGGTKKGKGKGKGKGKKKKDEEAGDDAGGEKAASE